MDGGRVAGAVRRVSGPKRIGLGDGGAGASGPLMSGDAAGIVRDAEGISSGAPVTGATDRAGARPARFR